jgi:hypothetical protein
MPKALELLPPFKKFQYQFAQHIRDPQKNPRPVGVPVNRMNVYNELLLNNFKNVLSGCFPVLNLLLGKRKWNKLVREFFSEHRCHRPFFRQIPEEFIDYLQKERRERSEDPPYLKHLAHYEWIELDLFVSEAEVDRSQIQMDGDLLEGHPVFTPALRVLSYPYQVHRIGPKYKPSHPDREPSFYLVFRNQEGDVEFMVLNSVTERLVELLLHSKLTGKEAIQQIIPKLHRFNPHQTYEGGIQILEELMQKGAILGTAPHPS